MERIIEEEIKKIAAEQVRTHLTCVQLLIHEMLKNLETKPGCENFTKEVVSSLEALRSQIWFGKEGVTMAIELTKAPLKRKS
ncbi:hypothetical protein D8R48_18010 [Salmonella enterica subsp. enterica serovar Newport]|nr:hypothetical protein [Salmonella enterica subsp. enterica serovar Newport]EEH9026725.1 hypothetical protein [Salmonella enterica subsp. enterica serovar Newport]